LEGVADPEDPAAPEEAEAEPDSEAEAEADSEADPEALGYQSRSSFRDSRRVEIDSRSTVQTAGRARFLDGNRVRVLRLTTLVDDSDSTDYQYNTL
jgi:hypothetical protein